MALSFSLSSLTLLFGPKSNFETFWSDCRFTFTGILVFFGKIRLFYKDKTELRVEEYLKSLLLFSVVKKLDVLRNRLIIKGNKRLTVYSFKKK